METIRVLPFRAARITQYAGHKVLRVLLAYGKRYAVCALSQTPRTVSDVVQTINTQLLAWRG